MLHGKRLLSLDVGSKRIGVAVSDHAGMMAHPLLTLDVKGAREDAKRIKNLCGEHEATGVVVGLPAHADNTESSSAKRSRKLAAVLVSLGVSVDFQDEWGTSLEARDALAHRKKGTVAKGDVDQAAAAAILSAYLEERRRRRRVVDEG